MKAQMTRQTLPGAVGRVACAAAVAALLAACEQGDPVSVAGGREGVAQLISANPDASTLPSGSANVRTNIKFDLSLQDAFGRRPSSAAHRLKGRYYRTAGEWLYPADTTGPARRGSGRMLDPRYPFLAPAGPRINDLRIIDPIGNGDDFYNPFFNGSITGLRPSTAYTIVLVHYRLKVVGQLDHVERITTGTVTQPDSLFLPPGSVYQQVNTNWTPSAPAGCAAYPGNANPFSYAQVTTGTAGTTNPDKCFLSGNGLATAAEINDPTKQLIGSSNDTPYGITQYNYWELWEGAYGTGTPVIRIQLAQDLDLNGAPIPNAYPPFPAPRTTGTATTQEAPPAIDRAATYPAPFEVQVTLPGAFGEPDSVMLTLTNLQQLEGGAVYKAWYVNPTTGAAAPATGDYLRIVDGDTVARQSGSSTFEGGPGTIVFTTDPYSQIGQPDVSDSLAFLLITQEQSAAATTPSTSQPIWVRVIKLPRLPVGGAVAFGDFNFRPGQTAATPEPFVPQGRMSGGVLGDTVTIFIDTTITEGTETRTVRLRRGEFVGSTLEVLFTQLMRPPIGYEYRGYLVGKVADAEEDTTLVDAGGLVGPNRESLANADVDPVTSNLTLSQIHRATLSYNVATSGPSNDTLCDYARFRLYLVPKGGAEPPATLIFDTALPERLTGARQCR